MINITAMSDIHGKLIDVKGKADLFIICGDISPLEIQSYGLSMGHWLELEFVPWVNSLPYKDENSKCILVAGNHDFVFKDFVDSKRNRSIQGSRLEELSDRIVYLENEEYIFKKGDTEYKIFGCPYCQELRGWAFCEPKEQLIERYSHIPNDTDILVLHDAPDILDGGLAVDYHRINFGNKLLADRIKEVKPKLTLFGHIHSSPIKEVTEFEEGCSLCNVCIVDEDYIERWKPRKINLS